MTQFYQLAIKDVRKETSDCVSISFDVPEALQDQFVFEPGQNITLRLHRDGEELRRSYSICSSPLDNELRVAVKRIPSGKFSDLANTRLKVGDIIEVMPPTGRFGGKRRPGSSAHYLAFAAGSGITPVISIIKTVLATEPDSRFTLVYGNRDRKHIIFKEQLEALKNSYMSRLVVHHILSREKTEAPLNSGRITPDKCEQLSRGLVDVSAMDHIFLCGPEEMIFSVRNWLLSKNVAADKIHYELFTVPGQKAAADRFSDAENYSGASSRVTIRLDGSSLEFNLPYEGQSILDGALREGADLPFSCKGGVCATCKAKLVGGQVHMETNYALEDEELADGFILTCQSHPRSAEVIIDFDAK